MPRFGTNTNHPKWNGGIHISSKGYKRISTKSGRNKYYHRYLIEKLLLVPIAARYVFPNSGVIPDNMTVHHVDHRNVHNCYGNLQLLDDRIHRFCEREYRKFIMKNYEEWLEYWREDNKYD